MWLSCGFLGIVFGKSYQFDVGFKFSLIMASPSKVAESPKFWVAHGVVFPSKHD